MIYNLLPVFLFVNVPHGYILRYRHLVTDKILEYNADIQTQFPYVVLP